MPNIHRYIKTSIRFSGKRPILGTSLNCRGGSKVPTKRAAQKPPLRSHLEGKRYFRRRHLTLSLMRRDLAFSAAVAIRAPTKTVTDKPSNTSVAVNRWPSIQLLHWYLHNTYLNDTDLPLKHWRGSNVPLRDRRAGSERGMSRRLQLQRWSLLSKLAVSSSQTGSNRALG